jgi:hypothetical protein
VDGNVGKAELEAALNALDIWIIMFGILVAIGAVGTPIAGYLHWRRGNQLQELQTAENLELQQGIARLRAESAEANARAAEASLELAKFRAPRSITAEQQTTIAEKLSRFEGTHFDMAVIPADPEAASFLGQISKTMQLAGWKWVEWTHPGGPLAFTYTWPGLPNVGQMGTTGIDIFLDHDHVTELWDAATTLALALKAEDFSSGTVKDVVKEQGIPNHDTIHVVIGKKPQ